MSSERAVDRGSRLVRGVEAVGVARTRTGSVIALVLLMGAGGSWVGDAVAQEPAQEPQEPAQQPAQAPSDPAEPIPALQQYELQQGEADSTPQARWGRAQQFVLDMQQASQSIQRQQQTARGNRDVVRVLCLGDKLNQVDVASRSAQDRLSALKVAVDSGDADGVQHGYTIIEVLNDRVRVLVNESNQCVGAETAFIGDAELSVSIDPNLPNVDTGFGPDVYSVPPPPSISSPIR
jgi:hypothetical protein